MVWNRTQQPHDHWLEKKRRSDPADLSLLMRSLLSPWRQDQCDKEQTPCCLSSPAFWIKSTNTRPEYGSASDPIVYLVCLIICPSSEAPPTHQMVHTSCLHSSACCVRIMWPRVRREKRGRTRRGTAGCATAPRVSAGNAADAASAWSQPVPWRTDQSPRGPRSRCCSSRCGRKLQTRGEQEISSASQQPLKQTRAS